MPDWTLTDRLRKAREHAGMRQVDLGEALGLPRPTIANYEQGVTVPRRPVLLAWAMATGVDLTWLEHGIAVVKDPEGEGLPHLDSNQEPSGSQTAGVVELFPEAA